MSTLPNLVNSSTLADVNSTSVTTMKVTTLSPFMTPSHPFSIKDETMLVTLIVMGVIVPAVFIFVFIAICVKRQRSLQQRRNEMLLRDTQDIMMDDLPYSKRVALASGRL